MLASVGWSDVVVVAAVVLVVLGLVSWLVSRSTVKGPTVPLPRPTLDAATTSRISELVRQGKTIEAIKVLRDATGLGLKQSKDWVESWQPGSEARPPTSVPVADDAVLRDLEIGARAVRQASGDIHAIKYVREQTGWGLKAAKDYVDRLR